MMIPINYILFSQIKFFVSRIPVFIIWRLLSKHEMLCQYWFNMGTALQTVANIKQMLAQHLVSGWYLWKNTCCNYNFIL